MVKELMAQMKDKVNFGIDTGIGIEIRDFFKGCENVENYNVSVIENKIYKISIKLKKFSLIESKNIFLAFLQFVEYSAGSFYLRKYDMEMATYSFLTFKEDLKGFYYELEFA